MNPWINNTESEPDEPEDSEGEQFGPWEITSYEFLPFASGSQEGMSVVAQIEDAEHATEYSVSFIRGIDEYDQAVNANETDEQLQERLLAAVTREANSPTRSLLMKARFRQ